MGERPGRDPGQRHRRRHARGPAVGGHQRGGQQVGAQVHRRAVHQRRAPPAPGLGPARAAASRAWRCRPTRPAPRPAASAGAGQQPQRAGRAALPGRRSAEDGVPQRQHGGALRGQRLRLELRRLLVQARPVLRAAQLAVGVGRGARRRRRAAGRRPRRAAAARCCRRCRAAPACAAPCASTRYCTANSTSIMPPGLCLTSKRPALHRVRGAHLLAHRADLLAQRGGVARRGEHAAAHAPRSAAQIARAPAQKRARVSAWCSQVHAVLLPRPIW